MTLSRVVVLSLVLSITAVVPAIACESQHYTFTSGDHIISMEVSCFAPYRGTPLIFTGDIDPHQQICFTGNGNPGPCPDRFVGAVATVKFTVKRAAGRLQGKISIRESVVATGQSPDLPPRAPVEKTEAFTRGAITDLQVFGYDESDIAEGERQAERERAKKLLWRLCDQNLYLNHETVPFATISWRYTLESIDILKVQGWTFVNRELNAQVRSRAEWNALVERSSVLYQAGKAAESEAGFRKALSEAQSLSIDPASVAIVWRNLGVAYWQSGHFVEAESAHKSALAELERLLPEDRRVLLILSAEMLRFYIRTNQIAKAERFEKHCREAAWWMSSSSQMAHVLNAVGMLRFAQRRFDEAEALFTEASAMEQRSTPDPALRTDLSANFAALYLSTSRAGDAVRLFERALDEERSRSGEKSPTLVTHLHNLALSYEAMGRNDEAAGILQQALSIADESYPRSHPVRVELLGSYARVLKSLHRNKESKSAARQAREIAHNTASLGGSSLLVDIADLTRPSVGR